MSAQPIPSPDDYLRLQEAAQWYAVLRDEEATVQDRAAWRAWLDQGPLHAQAWQHIEAVSRRFEPLHAAGASPQAAASALVRARGARVSRRRVLDGMGMLAGMGVLGWGVWRHTPLPGMALAQWADHRTVTGEVRRLALADGTAVWLNTASALDVDYSATLRRVRLVRGEVLIQTAGDGVAGRPFVADSAHGRMRALGTRFSVREQPDATTLAVTEGAVEVRTTGGALRVVSAGEQVRFDGERILESSPADPAREAWARGVLLADDMALQDLAAELGRYRNGYLAVAPEVARLRVMGTYPLQDTDPALAMLADTLPVQVRQVLPWWVVIEARSGR